MASIEVCSALPTTTWSIASALTPARCSAARAAWAPSSMALTSLNLPKPGVPAYSHMAVRAPPTMTISWLMVSPRPPRRLAACAPRRLRASATLEARLALLQERGHALAHVRGGRGEAEHVGLDRFPLHLGHIEPAADGFQGQAHRDRALGQDALEQRARACGELLGREDLVDHAGAPGLLGADLVAGQDPLERHTRASQPRQALRAAVPRDDAQTHLGQAHLRAGARRAQRAGERELEAAAQREAVEAGDRGLAHALQAREDLLAEGGQVLRLERLHLRQLVDVGAGHEGLVAGAGHDQAAHGRVGLELVEGGRELAQRALVERVEHLGSIDRDGRDLTVALDEQRLVAHRLLRHGWAPNRPWAGARLPSGS